MAKRKQLKSISYDLAHSFESRNNGGGCWALGGLYALALENASSYIVIDLIKSSIYPITSKFGHVVRQYSVFLYSQLERRGLPKDSVETALIRVEFSEKINRLSPVSARFRENQFTIKVSITDDRGKEYNGSINGWCFPL